MLITTLLFLIKRNSKNGPVCFFITAKCSALMLCPFSKLSVVVAKSFSNWQFATFLKTGRVVDFEFIVRGL